MITTQLDFNGHSIPIIKHDSDAWFSGKHIAECLEYTKGQRAIIALYNRHKDELKPYSYCPKLGTVTGEKATRVFNEEGVMIITMLSRQPKAAEFRGWAVKVLKDYRHQQLQLPAPIPIQPDQMLISKDEYIHMLKDKINFLEREKPRKRRVFSKDEKHQIMILHQQGKSCSAIGKQMGRNSGSINGIIRKEKASGGAS